MSEEKRYFPIFIDLSEKHVVVIGAGKIAARRIRTLYDFAGRITVIAPEISEDILSLCMEGSPETAPSAEEDRNADLSGGRKITLVRRRFLPADLEGADMVLAATDDKAVNRDIAVLCGKKGIPVNVSHDRALCDFYFPGVARKGNIVAGVTASGQDHAQARKVTEMIRELLDQE